MVDIRFLLRYIRPYRLSFAVSIAALLGSSLAGLAFPGLTGALIDAVESPSDGLFGNLDSLALLFLGILVLQSTFSFVRTYALQSVAERSLADLRRDLYGHMLYLPYDFFVRSRVGELTSRLSSDVTLIQTTMTTTLSELIRQSILLVGGITLVIWTSTQLTLVVLGAIPIVVLLAVLFGRYIRRISTEVQDEYAELNTTAEETLQGVSVVKAFTAERFEIGRYRRRLEEIVRLSMSVARARAGFVAFIVFLLFGGVVGVVWYGGRLVQAGELSIGELTSFVLYAAFVGGAMGSFADLYGGLQRALGAAERIRGILGMPVERSESVDGKPPSVGTSESITLVGTTISFDRVSFSYPSRPDVTVLENLSMTIPAGSTVAIVGPSGSGKSTIISLLLGYYPVEKGEIALGSQPLGMFDIGEVRRRCAVVSQDVVLFGGSIRENIAYGRQSAMPAEIREAARQAHALEFIERFPDGFDTIVGERGVQLSGGQRQRIAVARAIVRRPDLLMLDEATSALDSESEALVQASLDELMRERTSLVIAHRLSTVRNADHVIVLDNGKIVESGSYRSLQDADGPFSAMLAQQLLVR